MTDRELMQQALDALEEINKLSIGENAIALPAEIDTAMDALRERLSQPEHEPVAWAYPEALEAFKKGKPWTAYGSSGEGRIPLYLNDAVAPKAEPRSGESGAGFESLPASPNQPEQEPIQESPLTHNHLWIGDLYGRGKNT